MVVRATNILAPSESAVVYFGKTIKKVRPRGVPCDRRGVRPCNRGVDPCNRALRRRDRGHWKGGGDAGDESDEHVRRFHLWEPDGRGVFEGHLTTLHKRATAFLESW